MKNEERGGDDGERAERCTHRTGTSSLRAGEAPRACGEDDRERACGDEQEGERVPIFVLTRKRCRDECKIHANEGGFWPETAKLGRARGLRAESVGAAETANAGCTREHAKESERRDRKTREPATENPTRDTRRELRVVACARDCVLCAGGVAFVHRDVCEARRGLGAERWVAARFVQELVERAFGVGGAGEACGIGFGDVHTCFDAHLTGRKRFEIVRERVDGCGIALSVGVATNTLETSERLEPAFAPRTKPASARGRTKRPTIRRRDGHRSFVMFERRGKRKITLFRFGLCVETLARGAIECSRNRKECNHERAHDGVEALAGRGRCTEQTLEARRKLCYSSRVRLEVLVLLSAATLASCKGCKNEHPYTPYTIAGDAGDAEAVALADAEAPAATHEISATQAPPHATRWTLDGLTLAAPAGFVFELGVARDFDADGHVDAAALARRDGADSDLGTLLYYHAENGALASPVTVAASPSLTPQGASCTAKRKMSAIGRHSIWLELGVQCVAPSLREPSRQISVWALRQTPRAHLSANVIDPPGAPKLTFSVDGSDADGDGLDDVLLKVAVEGGDAPFEPLPRAEASLRWFDRPAGMSRDPDGPDGSLRNFAAGLAVRAAKAKDAPQVLAQARAVRVLWNAICAEGRAPRIVHVFGGSPISCGPSRALEEAGLAEARAHAALADALGAIAALERAQIPPATKTAQRTKDAEGWVSQIAPLTQATQVRAIAAVPQSSRTTAPAWGALAFESSGKLLVRTAAGVVRIDPDKGDENDASDVTAWPTNMISPDGTQRFLEAYDACDGISLRATLVTLDGGDLADVALPITPRPGVRCTTAKGSPASVVPLAWAMGGLETIISGEPILLTGGHASLLRAPVGQATPRGSARSPDGKTFAIATSLGVLVQGAKARLLRSTDLDGTYAEQRDCTASDDATHTACIRAGKAWVATF